MSLRAPPHNRLPLDMSRLSDACSLRLALSFEPRKLISAPIPLPLVEVQFEAEGITTLWVQVPNSMATQYRPGQYFMCWNPYDSTGGMSRPHFHSEKPYSVGDIRVGHSHAHQLVEAETGRQGRDFLGFTIKDLGRQSGELTRLSVGDWLAIRGPFGTAFPQMNAGERLVLVSGGIGSTPMHMAAREARHRLGDDVRIEAIMGFRNAEESHYVSRMESICDSLRITTDDGSLGTQGFPTALLPELLGNYHDGRTVLLTCGPEPMMLPVLQMAVDSAIKCYAAMERYLPCSMAVCGLCMVGDRLICKDGPVMDGDWLLQQDDFGSSHGHWAAVG